MCCTTVPPLMKNRCDKLSSLGNGPFCSNVLLRMLPAQQILQRLINMQRDIRSSVLVAHRDAALNAVRHETVSDTIYQLDALVEPILLRHCEQWGREQPLVLIAEGIEADPAGGGAEGMRVFPPDRSPGDAGIRLIVDPVDGTRGLMYDKRSAWSLAGVAPNLGPRTCLRDIEVAVMTELPTSKMGQADVLWAVRGHGSAARREGLAGGASAPLALNPSTASRIDHGFATITDFFPGTKVLAGELMEYLVHHLIGQADVTRAVVFEDQYISTGGQLYELMVGHDRFTADLRSIFYRIQGQPAGLCVHPYDLCTMLIAREAGVQLSDGLGAPPDGPLDVTTPLSWAGYANSSLRDQIEPLINRFLRNRLQAGGGVSRSAGTEAPGSG
jgi:hypothetical protein